MLESGKLILKLIVKHYNPFSFSLNEYGISDTKDSQSGKSNGIITCVGVKDIYILMLFRIVIVLVCIAAFFVTYFISDGIFNSDDKKVSTKRFVVYGCLYIIVTSLLGFLWFWAKCLKKQ